MSVIRIATANWEATLRDEEWECGDAGTLLVLQHLYQPGMVPRAHYPDSSYAAARKAAESLGASIQVIEHDELPANAIP